MFSREYQGQVAILLVAITAQLCTGIDFECNFDSGTCGFQQVTSWGNSGIYADHKNWIRAKSSEPIRYSGPAQDHTSGSGYYMVYDVYSFKSFGARAIIYKQITVTKSNTWIVFWYHQFGFSGMGGLTVYAGNTAIFSKNDNQGKGWKKAEIKLNVLGSVRLSFLGTKDGSQYGNIAIDDIVVAEYWKPNVTSLTAINSSVCLNSNVELECTANGYPPSEYSFYVNDKLVRKSFIGRQNIRTTVEGNATYRCQPTNVLGDGENATIEITTMSLPNVWLPAVAVVEGSTLNLFCNATGKMPFKYVWKVGYSNNIILPPSSDNNYTKAGIRRGYDYSDYSCLVTDRDGCSRESSPKTKIDIQYPPKSTSLYSAKSAVCLNDMATIRAYASRNPKLADFVLYSDGQTIVSTQTSSSYAYLTFNSTRVGTHTYICLTNNSVGIGKNASKIMVTKAPPKVTQITVNQTISEGSRLILECNTSGSDPMTVTWRKIGGSAFPSGRNVTFESLTTADHGAYECTASNGNECPAAKSQTYIYVLYKPRRTRITVSNNTVCLNDIVQFECTTDADPPATTYSFYLNDQLIQSSRSSSIQMNSTTEGNNTYRCQPSNTVGPGENATVFMNTKAPPNIMLLRNRSIAEGSKVVFPCNVTGSDPMNIVWRKVGVNSSYPVGHILTFNALMRSHDGGYECSASNGDECPSGLSSTYINVLYQPEITTSPKSTLTLYENGTIDLNCKAHGNPAANITWTRDSEIVGRGENLMLTKEQSEQAVYTCVASNGIGVDAKANSNVVVKICEDVCQRNTTCIRQGSTWSCDCRKGLTGRYCEKDDPMGKKFSLNIVLVYPLWKDEYSDSSSTDFKDLEKEICDEFQKMFFRTLIKCTLIIASKGSIITETDLEFNETKTESEVEGALSKASANNTLGPLKIKSSSSFQASVKDNMCETKPCLFKGTCTVQGDGYKCDCKLFRYGTNCENGVGFAAGIIIIIVVILLVVVNICVIVYLCCLIKKKGYATDSLEEKDMRMESYKVKNGNQVSPSYNGGFDDKSVQSSGSIEKPAIA